MHTKIPFINILAHELWTTLRADGVKGPFYVQSKNPRVAALDPFDLDVDNARVALVPLTKNPVTKKNIRPGEAGMKAYLDFMIDEAQFFQEGDILISDGERSFDTPLIQEYLKNRGIYLFVIEPSVLHQFMNPCDNHFHSILKLSYYREISHGNYQHVSVDQKFRIAKNCWDKIDQETIVQMFKKCGLISTGEDKRSIVMKLMHEGLSCLGKHNNFHRQSLLSYLEWCKDNNLRYLSSSLSSNMMKIAGFV